MKNANIFVDVDHTLVDANGNIIDGAKDALERLKAEGCHLHLWSIGRPNFDLNLDPNG